MEKEKHILMNKVELQNPRYNVLLNEYDLLIKSKNLVVKGKGHYQCTVKEFLYWLELRSINKIRQVQTSDMIDYDQYLRTRPNKRKPGTLSESMINQHNYSLRMLFDYLLETKQIKSAVLLPKNNQGTNKERQIITMAELELIMSHCQTKREKAIISVAYGCGLRRSEINLLNSNDLNFANGLLVVRKGKLYKRRDVPMSNNIIKYLKDYLINERPLYLKDNNRLELAFFINNRGKRMSGDNLNEVLKEIISRTKKQSLIKKEITLHCLRHSIAAHLIDNGADIEFVQSFLGHAQIDTSHIYARRRKRKQLFNHQ